MSTNLNAPALTGGQANPETTVNDAVGAMDAAITELLVVDLTNSVALTAPQYRGAIRFSVTPAGVGKTLTLQAIKRLVFVTNDSANSITVANGTTNFALAAGGACMVYTDGTANGLVFWLVTSTTAPVPYDLGLFVPGAPTASQVVLRFNVVRAFTLPVSLTGSVATAGAASAATATFTIKQNGTSIGTIVFSTSATATFTFAGAVTFAVNDVITVVAPASADATLSDIAINFKGTR
jgi:hypothetical protein